MVESVDVEEMQTLWHLGETPVPAFAAFRVSNRTLSREQDYLIEEPSEVGCKRGVRAANGKMGIDEGQSLANWLRDRTICFMGERGRWKPGRGLKFVQGNWERIDKSIR